ncbi:hypothetical protein B0H67DRAFT_299726 [Lasiosphaeris hirsuta]|uniref:Uncharacterized protein n=1 Tax=Lasiosphaeris hirsuta TaxID=260670 RepID=A0AA40A9I0_9PEZI|nr:hypothetical protein B0H67DRAFT_299726 [Lasiosphaeris hirsuta]
MASESRFAPGRTVAVIGAGIGGISAAAYLLKEGLSVTVFERADVAGGIWHFDERVPDDPPYPSQLPSLADYQPSQPGEFAYATPPPDSPVDGESRKDDGGEALETADSTSLEVRFAPPGACYAGLTNNIPTSILVSSLGPWPEGTALEVSQDQAESYIQGLSRKHGVHAVTQYNMRVDEARKSPDGTKWEVRTVTLEWRRAPAGPQLIERTRQFDLLAVASGHYSTPRVPDFAGLREWKAAFPARVTVSKQYRRPDKFRGKNILVIGAGVSGSDICRETAGIASTVYQSVRGGLYDTPAHLLPKSTIRIGEVDRFVLNDSLVEGDEQQLGDDTPLPGSIVLKDGTVLQDIHHVVIAVGYITSYPFLPHLQSDTVAPADAGPELLVTSDGNMAHNLHKDIFYIPDPTLAFIGVPYHAVTFALFDFQAKVLARVFSGRAFLPARADMVEEYQAKVKDRGVGRKFHSLAETGREVGYVKDLVDWVNRDGEPLGEPRIAGHEEEWVKELAVLKDRLTKAWFGAKPDVKAEGSSLV